METRVVLTLIFNYLDIKSMLKMRLINKCTYTIFINYDWQFHSFMMYHKQYNIMNAIINPANINVAYNTYEKINYFVKYIHYRCFNLNLILNSNHSLFRDGFVLIKNNKKYYEKYYETIARQYGIDIRKLKNIVFIIQKQLVIVYNHCVYYTVFETNDAKKDVLIKSINLFTKNETNIQELQEYLALPDDTFAKFLSTTITDTVLKNIIHIMY